MTHETKTSEKIFTNLISKPMVEQLLNLKRLNSSVVEYLAQFKYLLPKCEIEEDQIITVRRFVNGLRFDIQWEVSLSFSNTKKKASRRTIDIKKNIKLYPICRVSS